MRSHLCISSRCYYWCPAIRYCTRKYNVPTRTAKFRHQHGMHKAFILDVNFQIPEDAAEKAVRTQKRHPAITVNRGTATEVKIRDPHIKK